MAVIPCFDERERYLRELVGFLEIPSVSGDDARRDSMRAAASWLVEQLDYVGGRLVETGGHPAVLAEWLGAPGAPTILVYGHYDVQPPGDEAEWESPAFAPAVRDGRIYARGATDDKGPVFIALKVAQAFHSRSGRLPLNVRFLFEGEEEIGSPSLPAFLEAHRDDFAADLVVSADGAMWRPTEPSVAIAAKGLLALDLIVTGPGSDLHSGRHGGAVQNPNHALGAIIAGLHTPDGAVAVAGFSDDVVPLSAADRDALERVPFDEETYRRQVGVPALHGEPGYTTLERLWARPTLEVNGIQGGGSFTVIPRRANAHITCRLVPGQRPEAVLAAITRHVEAHVPRGVEVRVEAAPAPCPPTASRPGTLRSWPPPRRSARSTPTASRCSCASAGRSPAAVLFERILGLKTLLFSFSIADENLHAPNEFFRLERLEEGMRAWAELWTRLAEVLPSGEPPA